LPLCHLLRAAARAARVAVMVVLPLVAAALADREAAVKVALLREEVVKVVQVVLLLVVGTSRQIHWLRS